MKIYTGNISIHKNKQISDHSFILYVTDSELCKKIIYDVLLRYSDNPWNDIYVFNNNFIDESDNNVLNKLYEQIPQKYKKKDNIVLWGGAI